MNDKQKEILSNFDYSAFKLLDMYSDYGDVTGIQVIRRFIDHVNEFYTTMNISIEEFIKLYTDLGNMIAEFDGTGIEHKLDKTVYFEGHEEIMIEIQNIKNLITDLTLIVEENEVPLKGILGKDE